MMTRQAWSSSSDHGIRHPHDLGNRAYSSFKPRSAYQVINPTPSHLAEALRSQLRAAAPAVRGCLAREVWPHLVAAPSPWRKCGSTDGSQALCASQRAIDLAIRRICALTRRQLAVVRRLASPRPAAALELGLPTKSPVASASSRQRQMATASGSAEGSRLVYLRITMNRSLDPGMAGAATSI
jgi:hypothetical protein